jgi:twitching motility protein PilT
MQTGRKQGMKLMDDSLLELYQAGLISQEEAYSRAEQKALMKQHFRH